MADCYILKDGIYRGILDEAIEGYIHACWHEEPQNVFPLLKLSGCGKNILLLADNQLMGDERMVHRSKLFASNIGAAVKYTKIGHGMHLKNPEMIVEEIREWFE